MVESGTQFALRKLLQLGVADPTGVVDAARAQTGIAGGLSLGPVSYIAGVALLILVSVFLLATACYLRRKDRRDRAAEAEQQAQSQQTISQADTAADGLGSRRVPLVIPVVIVQPNGEMYLAEACGKAQPLEDMGGAAVGQGGDPKQRAAGSAATI